MTAGTKVTIAVVVLFTVVLGVYYGFMGPGGSTPPVVEAGVERPADPPVARDPVMPEVAAGTGTRGILSQSVDRALPESPSAGVLATDAGLPARVVMGEPQPARGGQPAGPVADVKLSPRISPARVISTPVTRPAPTAASDYVEYTVQEDDSMWTIAEDWFGTAVKWTLIAKANPHIEAKRLQVGQVLRLPPKRGAQTTARPKMNAPAVVSSRGMIYTVRSGDTLTTIAKLYYGDTNMWSAIYAANRNTIGQNPDRLTVGMKLEIPTRRRVTQG